MKLASACTITFMLTTEKQLGDGDLQPIRLNFFACIDLHTGSGAVTLYWHFRLGHGSHMTTRNGSVDSVQPM